METQQQTRVTDEPNGKAAALSDIPTSVQIYPWGQIHLGDCLAVAAQLTAKSQIPLNNAGSAHAHAIDLIYIDPPFFTERPQIGSPNPDGAAHTFEDRWRGGLTEYLGWLEARIRALRPLLKSTGVMLLHLDWHAVHYAKVMCDRIFSEPALPLPAPSPGGFQNELIWYYQTGGASKGRFSRKHDTILLYSNSASFYFDGDAIAIPRTPKAMKRAQCATGARIAATDTHKNPDDVITIPALNPMARERTGYPTQKPVALLELFIKALCPPSGTVADFFCGSGTALVAAERLGRRWFGCDLNPTAVAIARQRIADIQMPAALKHT